MSRTEVLAPVLHPSATTRLAVALLGLAGAGAVAYGVTRPWLSTFNDLLEQSGWGTRNGTVLVVGAAVAAVLALAQAVRATPALRWLLALTGFAMAAFGGYLLVQLYGVFDQLGAMSFASKGPGLYVVVAGAFAVFATIFLPMPGAAATSDVQRVDGRPRVGSRLRVPVALLAAAAGLAHVPVTPEHLAEARYVGVLFMALTVTCVLGATALLISDAKLVYAGLATACLLAVLAYLASRTVGLPLVSDDIGSWNDPIGIVAIACESGVLLLSALALRKAR